MFASLSEPLITLLDIFVVFYLFKIIVRRTWYEFKDFQDPTFIYDRGYVHIISIVSKHVLVYKLGNTFEK